FFFQALGAQRNLHSFPTRRSSDLPWAKRFWELLGFSPTIDVRTPDGDVLKDRPMWTYWNLQEGETRVDPLMFATADGGAPPVIQDRKSTRLNSSHVSISYAVFCLK